MIGEIQKHFDGFGLEPQFAQHTRMNALSGGQKVKVCGWIMMMMMMICGWIMMMMMCEL